MKALHYFVENASFALEKISVITQSGILYENKVFCVEAYAGLLHAFLQLVIAVKAFMSFSYLKIEIFKMKKNIMKNKIYFRSKALDFIVGSPTLNINSYVQQSIRRVTHKTADVLFFKSIVPKFIESPSVLPLFNI